MVKHTFKSMMAERDALQVRLDHAEGVAARVAIERNGLLAEVEQQSLAISKADMIAQEQSATIFSLLQERDSLKAHVAELEAERDKAQSAVTAWRGACESLEAHLQDRVAMGDGAKPQVYLEILRAEIANIRRASEQIVASRWADYARHKAINSELEGLCSEMARVLKNTNDLYEELHGHKTAYSQEARAALSRARDMGIEP